MVSELERLAKEQARKYAEENRELLEAFQLLERYQPFREYQKLLDRMVEARGSDLLTPCSGVESVLVHEHLKGTMNGLILARDLPSITIATMKADLTEDEE